jgi:hypothetical protein
MMRQTEEQASTVTAAVPETKPPSVSIIMPTYGQAHLIGASIDSVLAQSLTDFELIIINDESPDDTEQVVAGYKDRRIRYIWQKNKGLPGARNSGLQIARGAMIALLDGDDLYEPDYLRILVEKLNATPVADAVYCRARFVNEANELLPQITGGPVPPEQLYDQLLTANFLTPNCLLAYRYCYEQVGYFDTTIPRGEGDVWLQFARRFHVVGIDAVLARYRVLNRSMSAAAPLLMLESAQEILHKHLGKPGRTVYEWLEQHRKAFGRSYITAAVEFLQMDDVDNAYRQLQQVVEIAPELLVDTEVLNELAWGNQPRGYRGDFSTLDVAHNASVLLALLDKLFAEPILCHKMHKYQRQTWATAYLVLGMLSYGADDLKSARRFFWHAIVARPDFVFRSELLLRFAKSLLGRRVLALLRRR